MCITRFFTNTSSYTIKVVHINGLALKNYVSVQRNILYENYKNKMITLEQYNIESKALTNWKGHCIHPELIEQNYTTGETNKHYIVITQQDKIVEIHKSLSLVLLGEKMENSNVIKIAENLYITSHSIIPLVNTSMNSNLEFTQLKYNPVKDCYVDPETLLEYENLTKKNMTQMNRYVLNYLNNTQIKKYDIVNIADIENDLYVVKNIDKWKEGFFNKKTNETYEELGQRIDKYNYEIQKLDMIDSINKNFSDEL